MKNFFQRADTIFWSIIFFLIINAIGLFFWEDAYINFLNFLESFGRSGNILSSILSFLFLLIIAIAPFLWLLVPLFLVIWFIVKRNNRRTSHKEKSVDTFHLTIWIIFVIGAISILIISIFFTSLLSWHD